MHMPHEKLRPKAGSIRGYIVNVGVNTSHDIASPLFADGTFEFVPIPEGGSLSEATHDSLTPITYSDLYCYNTIRPLLSLYSERIQRRYAQRLAHHDPNLNNPNDGDLAQFTYGDLPYANARASSLRHVRIGDMLFFIANLAEYCMAERRFAGTRGLYLVGVIEVSAVLEFIPSEGVMKGIESDRLHAPIEFKTNAHVNHLYALPRRYQQMPFTVFQGSMRSARFRYAVPVTEELCRDCLRDRNGEQFDFSKFRSPNACIGSYTRTARAHFDLGGAEKARFLRLIRWITECGNDLSFPDPA